MSPEEYRTRDTVAASPSTTNWAIPAPLFLLNKEDVHMLFLLKIQKEDVHMLFLLEKEDGEKVGVQVHCEGDRWSQLNVAYTWSLYLSGWIWPKWRTVI